MVLKPSTTATTPDSNANSSGKKNSHQDQKQNKLIKPQSGLSSQLLSAVPSPVPTSLRRLSIQKTLAGASALNGYRSSIVNGLANSINMSTSNSMYREIQISKMFAVIFIVFLFGFFPYSVTRMFDKKNSLHPDVYILLSILFMFSIRFL